MSAPIIITVPSYLSMDTSEAKIGIADVSPMAMSKKRRLDHLSWEEKMQRKKLKNRVAAQTSRDRKKAKMDDMEGRIEVLEMKNEKLMSEMASLRALNERLASENQALRKAAARDVPAGPAGPAAGGPHGGVSHGTSAPDDVPALTDVLAHLDSDEYLDTLQQLAETLLREIDTNHEGPPPDSELQDPRQRVKGSEVVGPAPSKLESSQSGIVESKHDIHRILAQHSYAHPYTESKCPSIQVTQYKDLPSLEVDIKEEIPDVTSTELSDGDKGDMYYDEASDCITIEVTSDDQSSEDESYAQNISVETYETLCDENKTFYLDENIKMLSPMSACSLSPVPSHGNLQAVSPAYTSSSDLGYESVASPLSEPEQMDLSDFWCDSFSELFPGLA